MNVLHVANGDLAVADLQDRFPGNTISVWREILAVGPIDGPIANEAFWNVREAFIRTTYGADTSDYRTKVVEEFTRITATGRIRDLRLWFDEDLMCQINQAFLLYHLRPPYTMGARIHVRCGDSSIELHHEDLAYAARMWRIYAGGDAAEMALAVQEDAPPVLLPLREACRLHLGRVTGPDNPVASDVAILRSYIDQGITSSYDIMVRFLQEHPEYGYGDLQIEALLRSIGHPLQG